MVSFWALVRTSSLNHSSPVVRFAFAKAMVVSICGEAVRTPTLLDVRWASKVLKNRFQPVPGGWVGA